MIILITKEGGIRRMEVNCYSMRPGCMFFEVNNRIFKYYTVSKEIFEIDEIGNVIETYTETDDEESEEIIAIYNYLK
jgi:hypothetical protein